MGLTLEELLSSVEEALPPPGPSGDCKTTTEWAQHWGVSRARADEAIRRLVALGKMVALREARLTRAGYPQRLPVYRLVD
jgi:hypothetical protein